jgi:thioredoxin-related protein
MRQLFIASFVAASALIISFSFISKTPQKESAGIKWITLQEAEKLNKQKPKKIMVDLFTSWCGWCKQLDATTFQDAKVIEYVNQNFYAVKFNAERPDTIVFNKDTLVNLGVPLNRRTAHQFATQYGSEDGRIGYPTIAYIDGMNKKIQGIPGYLNAQQFLVCLRYINDNHYKTKTFETFYNEEMTKK